ncbi:MAG: PDDEXK nuclease domain-containing protein [Gemmataceae bacterium]|nr:PDDEXK nuclease domain-containing protein [Gemmataceae bacterium]MCI0738527.1 PDDEXK nuclease domain-containing protein [Gemmataceae bacterium]
MSKRRKLFHRTLSQLDPPGYNQVLGGVVELLESARRAAAKTVNAFMTASYWEIGRRIVAFEQGGKGQAEYGTALLKRLGSDLSAQFGRGFSWRNLYQMRGFYLAYPQILQTLSAKFKRADSKEKGQTPSVLSTSDESAIFQTVSGKTAGQSIRKKSSDESADQILATLSRKISLADLARRFPLPWSHYVLLLKVEKPQAREYYEAEALRNGWTVRQLERQITTLFYERTLASRNKAAMLKKGAVAKPGENLTPEEEIKDPLILEFLGLKDEYSESDLEEALIRQLESFLLELGGDFAFVGRQRRLRIGDEWYRLDLLFFHRRLRCLVVIDLKLGKFTHADAGQMHLYLRYASRHWTNPGENPPVGLILCAHKDEAVAHYALDDLPNKVLAAQYRLALPDERTLEAELARTRRLLENRRPRLGRKP